MTIYIKKCIHHGDLTKEQVYIWSDRIVCRQCKKNSAEKRKDKTKILNHQYYLKSLKDKKLITKRKETSRRAELDGVLTLTDTYIKRLLVKRTSLKRKDISKELIEQGNQMREIETTKRQVQRERRE